MSDNPTLKLLMNRKSIRKYTDRVPDQKTIETILRAGQQAPFASQLYSVVWSRRSEERPMGAPLLFTFCVDLHKLKLFMARRNWAVATCDLSLLLFGIQDATLVAENMVIAAESLGLGSCFIGMAPYRSEALKKEMNLPERVFPLVQLILGYPAEDPPTRPRYPLAFAAFEDKYPDLSDEDLTEAMKVMDDGYMAQDYYRGPNLMLPLEGDRKETYTFDDYGWTEHISRKWGQWHRSPEDLLSQFRACGFDLMGRGGE